VPWDDLGRIATTVSKLLADGPDPFERRWRKVLFVVNTLKKATFDGDGDPKKAITGARFGELLELLAQEADAEEPKTATEVKRPGWAGRMVFRQLAAVFSRKDHGAEKGAALRGPVTRFWSAVRFASGSGGVPKIHAALPEQGTFAAGEVSFGPPS